MIIVFGAKPKETSVLVCTSCYMQKPVALHEILDSNYGGKCEICSSQDVKLRSIISYTIGGVAHQILSDIGFYRVILIDRHKLTRRR